MANAPAATYPIDASLRELREQLQPGATVLLQAPPGAGKTTRVPLALLGHWPEIPGLEGTVLMLEPRRLATKAAASRLAHQLNEPVGEQVGYAVRHEQQRSSRTRLEVVTAGLFLRRLQVNPELPGVSCVIFDEFHERGRDSDLGLAFVRDVQAVLRPDLRLLLMSATLDLGDLRSRLPEAAVVTSEGRSYPVETHHLPPRSDEPLSRTVLRAMEEHGLALANNAPGSVASGTAPPTVLVFLPGVGEIERCREQLEAATSLRHWDICCLHGQQALSMQAEVLRPCRAGVDGRVVLATAIAESSLTIDGVGLVIDSGLSRHTQYAPGSGMEGLITVPSSVASADQRRGRAGRQGPGQCVRLWSPAEQQRRPAHDPPELERCDPQPLVLDLAAWGAGLGDDLPWINHPPRPALQEGQQQLQRLGVLTPQGQPSTTGQQIARLGTHPRLALILLQANAWGHSRVGADLAAILSERDPLNSREHGVDLGARLQLLRRGGGDRLGAIRRLSQQFLRQLKDLPALSENALPGWNTPAGPDEPEAAIAARLIAIGFPDWLALQRDHQPGRYQLRQGRGAQLHEHDPFVGQEALAVARLDQGRSNAQIQLALPLPKAWLIERAELEGEWHSTVFWDDESGGVRARRNLMLGSLCLRSQSQPKPPAEDACQLLLERLREQGLQPLPWSARSEQVRARLQLLHQQRGAPWPCRDLNYLQQKPDQWLETALLGCVRWRDLSEETLIEALWGDLDWSARQQVNQWLPEHITIPSGRAARLTYSDQEVVLAVKLQEMFGCEQGPTVLDGSLPVTLELLSPAGRPLQRTQDLAGFWQGSYQEVRREMRGRYPKHPWPEDPRTSQATAKTKARLNAESESKRT